MDEQGIIQNVFQTKDTLDQTKLKEAQANDKFVELEDGQYFLPGFIVLHVYASQWPQAGIALFDVSAILTMLVIDMVLLAETTGTWYAVSAVTEETVTDEQINKGVIDEGVGCLMAALVGTTPMTGYSTNAGIISITGVASKKVFIMASVWFIILSFLGKLSALIHAIPSSVIDGVFSVVCVIIMLSGFRVIKNQEFSERELYIIGVPLIVAIGLLFMPAKVKQSAPQFIQYLLDSPISLSAIVAVAMNKLIPETK